MKYQMSQVKWRVLEESFTREFYLKAKNEVQLIVT